MNVAAGHQFAIAEISQRGIVELDDVDACRRQSLRFARQDLREMIKEMLQRGISLTTMILVPITNGNQKGTGQRELGYSVSVLHQEAGILEEDRFVCGHSLDDDFGELGLPLMRETPAALEAADA